MKKIFYSIVCLFLVTTIHAQNIYTVCGNDTMGYNGDSILATAAEIYAPVGIAFDKYNNLYFCDAGNYRIRKIDTNGIITTIAGTGLGWAYNGDSIQATAAQISPGFMNFDSAGNIYFNDVRNYRLRKIDVHGIITTLAGTGIDSYNGDSIPATDAMIWGGGGTLVDRWGNIIFCDYNNNRIRKIDHNTGYIYTIAGTGIYGYNGDSIAATNAQITGAFGIAFDIHGNIVFCDVGNCRVRMIDASTGYIYTIAGTGAIGFGGDGGIATAAIFNGPGGIAIDSNNNMFICDGDNYRVRLITAADNKIHTIAGTGVFGYNGDGIPATTAELEGPQLTALDKHNRLFFCDVGNERIRMITGPLAVASPRPSPKEREVSVWPNPAKFTISITSPQIINQITITNLLGQCVYSSNYGLGIMNCELNIAGWVAGVYFVKVNGVEVQRLVKE